MSVDLSEATAFEATVCGAEIPGLGLAVRRLADGETVTVGSALGSDIVLQGDDLVSRRHALVTRRGDQLEVQDRSGTAGLGIYHAGERVSDALLTPGSRFSIGRHDFFFDGEWIYQHDDMGLPSLHVDELDVDVPLPGKRSRRLLHDTKFVLWERTLLGVIGPSGSGKSTLLKAITGLTPATSGTTRFNGRDLYAHYSELRTRIGMVPQEDVLHKQLTVRQELEYAAALRLAPDMPRRRKHAVVDGVIAQLDLADASDTRIANLSGGERKRVSVAIELLTKPSLLALDEPTTGLDPHLDRQIMEKLVLAKEDNRIIIVVTHTPLHIDLCDHVLVLCRGRMAYFGPPGHRLLDFFGAANYSEVFAKVAEDHRDFWHCKYVESDVYREFVSPELTRIARGEPARPARPTGPLAIAATPHVPIGPVAPTPLAAPAGSRAAAPLVAGAAPGSVPARPDEPARTGERDGVQDAPARTWLRHPSTAIATFFTLFFRTMRVTLTDKVFALLLLLVPMALAALSRAIPGTMGLAPDPAHFNVEAQRLLVVLTLGACFLGLANSIREVIKEEATYRRERAAGLSPGLYLLAKFAVLAVLGSLQSALFVWLTLAQRFGPAAGTVLPPVPELMIGVAAVTVTCTALGLAISTAVRSADQAVISLVVVVMAQLMLSGPMIPIRAGSIIDHISWVNPARWGFAAVAATTDLNLPWLNDRLWDHTPHAWFTAIGVLALQGVLCLLLARAFIRRLEPGRRAR